MRPTKEQWERLHTLATAAANAQAEFETATLLLAMESDEPIRRELIELVEKQSEPASFRFAAYMLCPQSEWVGGDSMNPKNFKTREPNVVPLPRQYLTETTHVEA